MRSRTIPRGPDLVLGGAATFASFAFLLKLVRNPAGFLGIKGLVALAIVTALWLALALPRGLRARIALLLCCTAVPLVGAEVALRYLERRQNLLPAILSGMAYDRRSPLQFVREERDTMPDLTPRLAPTWMSAQRMSHAGSRIVPLGNVPYSRVVDCNELGIYSVGRMDRYGFRNPDTLWDDLPRPAIAVVGDSFAFGSCVEDGREFVSIVRRRFPGTFNLGQGGNGPLLELATLREYALPLRPEVVIWQLYEGNDLDNLGFEAADPLLLGYLEDGFSQHLTQRSTEVGDFLKDEAEQLVAGTSRHAEPTSYSTLGVLSLYHIRNLVEARLRPRTPPPEGDERWERLSRILDRARDEVESRGGRFLLLYVPTWASVALRSDPGYGRDRMFEVFGALGIEVLDLTAHLRSVEDPLALYPFRQNGHWNEAGNELVAERILARLATR